MPKEDKLGLIVDHERRVEALEKKFVITPDTPTANNHMSIRERRDILERRISALEEHRGISSNN